MDVTVVPPQRAQRAFLLADAFLRHIAAAMRLLGLRRYGRLRFASLHLLGFGGGDFRTGLRDAALMLHRFALALHGKLAQFLQTGGNRLALLLPRLALVHLRGQFNAAFGQRTVLRFLLIGKIGELVLLRLQFVVRRAYGRLGLPNRRAQEFMALVVGIFLHGKTMNFARRFLGLARGLGGGGLRGAFLLPHGSERDFRVLQRGAGGFRGRDEITKRDAGGIDRTFGLAMAAGRFAQFRFKLAQLGLAGEDGERRGPGFLPDQNETRTRDQFTGASGDDRLRLGGLEVLGFGQRVDDMSVLQERGEQAGGVGLRGDKSRGVSRCARGERRGPGRVERSKDTNFAVDNLRAPIARGAVVGQEQSVDGVAQEQRKGRLVTVLHGEPRRKCADLLCRLAIEQPLRGLRCTRMLRLELRQRVASSLQTVAHLSDFVACLFRGAEFLLRLALGLPHLVERRTLIAEPGLSLDALRTLPRQHSLCLLAALAQRGLLALQRLEPQLKITLLEFQSGQLLLLLLPTAFLGIASLLDLGALTLDQADARGEHVQRFLFRVEFFLRLLALAAEVFHLCIEMREIFLRHVDLFLRRCDLAFGLITQAEKFLHPRVIRGGALLGPLERMALPGLLVAQAHQFRLQQGQFASRRGELRFLRRHFRLQLLLALARAVNLALQGANRRGVSIELVPPQFLFQHSQFGEARLVTARLARLPLQRSDLPLDFANDVGESHEIRLGVLQLAQRLFFLTFEFGDARRFLENRASVLGPRGENLVELALLHD